MSQNVSSAAVVIGALRVKRKMVPEEIVLKVKEISDEYVPEKQDSVRASGSIDL